MSRFVALALAATFSLGALAVAPAAAPAARRCPGHIDFFVVRAYDGATCVTARRVEDALYTRGFNAVGGSRQLVEVSGRAWRCTWRSSRVAPTMRCVNLEGRGAIRARLSVDY